MSTSAGGTSGKNETEDVGRNNAARDNVDEDPVGGEVSSEDNVTRNNNDNDNENTKGGDDDSVPRSELTDSVSQPQHPSGYPPAQLTPQPIAGYYLGYPQQQRVTPEPPSPGGHSAMNYDVTSFLQQQAVLAQTGVINNPFGGTAQYNGIPQPPLSPGGRGGVNGSSMGIIPPASPLFPRAASNAATSLSSGSLDQQHQPDSSVLPPTPASPSAYLSPTLGGVYQGYGVNYGTGSGNGSSNSMNSPDDSSQANNQQYQQNAYQQGASRTGAGYRANSFDEMLPPSMLDQIQDSPLPYSNSSGVTNGGTLFAHQQPWGYGASGEMYSPGSRIQQRPNPHYQMPGQFPGQMRQMGPPLGVMPPYFPATSPGPPIQTTASNKGPDGANLFIFHIPNHFTNLDMYHLFARYGNLLSVRIMVEKDTGRSRGFGFVSYDLAASAALAIKELNGFAIGNKRLKVQHKQIRASDRQQDHFNSPAHNSGAPPPHGSNWYGSQNPASQAGPADSGDGLADNDAHGTSGGQAHLESPNENNLGDVANSSNSSLPPKPSSAPSSVGVDLTTLSTNSTALSPLANLEPLMNALPDVPNS